jgi:LacI family transcriptional regulator
MKGNRVRRKVRVTSSDVAAYAGLSRATVSKVLNNPDTDTVTPETKQKVFEAAEKLGYRKNLAGRSLMEQKAYTIGLLSIWDLGSFLFSETTNGILKAALEQDYRLTFCGFLSQSDQSGIKTVVDYYREGGIDGVICLVATDFDRQVIYQLIEESRENHIPLVFMNSGLTDRDIDDVTPDYYQIGALGTEYLLRLGHRRIGFVAHQPGHLSMEERFAGYRDALVKHGCFHEEYVVIHNEDPQSVRTG